MASKAETTLQLTRGQYRITHAEARSSRWIAALLLIAICAAYVAWNTRGKAPEAELSAELAQLTEQNKALREQLDQLKLNADHEAAMRKELQSQLDERATQVKKLQDDIGFYRSQRAAAVAAASGPSPAR